MILKPADRYRSTRRLRRRIGRLVCTALAGVARQDERSAEYLRIHAAAEDLRATLDAEMRLAEQQFREGRIAMLCLGIPALIVIGMMLAFVAGFRRTWPLLVIEIVGALLAASIHERVRIRASLRPVRRALRELEREARAADRDLKDAGTAPTRGGAATRGRRWASA